MENNYEINSLEFSPDNKYLASACLNEVNIFEINNNYKCAHTIYPRGTTKLTYSNDSKYLACAGLFYTLIYDTSIYFPLYTLDYKNLIHTISFSEDSNYLATGTLYEIKIFNALYQFKLLYDFTNIRKRCRWIESMAFSQIINI